MKVRLDFITNSSSTCYICEICQKVKAYDCDVAPWSVNMIVCDKCESDFCNGCLSQSWLDKCKYYMGDGPFLESCPVCSFEMVSNRHILRYVKKINPNIKDEIKSRFKSYDEFKKFAGE